jgi:hypothetical protein
MAPDNQKETQLHLRHTLHRPVQTNTQMINTTAIRTHAPCLGYPPRKGITFGQVAAEAGAITRADRKAHPHPHAFLCPYRRTRTHTQTHTHTAAVL